MIHSLKKVFVLMDKKVKIRIIFLGIVIVFYSFTSIIPVYYIQKIIDSIDLNSPNNAIKNILFYGMIYLILQIAGELFGALSQLIAQKTQTQFGSDLQVQLYDNFLHSHLHNQDNSTVLANRLIEDTKYISSHLLSSIQLFFKSILNFCIGVFFMTRINLYLTLIIFPLGMITSFTSHAIEKRAEVYADEKRNAEEGLWKCFSQGILGALTLRMYDQDESYLSLIRHHSQNVKDVSYQQSRLENLSEFMVGSLYMITIGGIMIFSAIFVTKGLISIGGLTALMMYNHMLVDPLMNLLECKQQMIKSKISLQRIEYVLTIETRKRLLSQQKIDKIIFDHVNFSYDQKVIFHDINFTFTQGKYIMKGPSGIGKTTLVNLITGMLESSKGTICYYSGDEKVNNFPDIGYLMQDGFLFDVSIKENIKIANKELSDEKLHQLIQDCCLDDIYERMQDKSVGENGNLLSGGERKRLLLAQTLARSECDILIFDELSSSLDMNTYRVICEKIEPYLKDKICLFIEHSSHQFIKYDYEISIHNKTIQIQKTWD